MSNVLDLSAPEQFEDVISDPERPVLVDFWADWCGPCKMLAPVLERLAREYDGRLTFARLNVDEFPDISRRYGVNSLPTMIIFRQRKAATRISGFKPEGALRPPPRPLRRTEAGGGSPPQRRDAAARDGRRAGRRPARRPPTPLRRVGPATLRPPLRNIIFTSDQCPNSCPRIANIAMIAMHSVDSGERRCRYH